MVGKRPPLTLRFVLRAFQPAACRVSVFFVAGGSLLQTSSAARESCFSHREQEKQEMSSSAEGS